MKRNSLSPSKKYWTPPAGRIGWIFVVSVCSNISLVGKNFRAFRLFSHSETSSSLDEVFSDSETSLKKELWEKVSRNSFFSLFYPPIFLTHTIKPRIETPHFTSPHPAHFPLNALLHRRVWKSIRQKINQKVLKMSKIQQLFQTVIWLFKNTGYTFLALVFALSVVALANSSSLLLFSGKLILTWNSANSASY